MGKFSKTRKLQQAVQAFKDWTSGSLGTLGNPFRFVRRGPKGPLIENSGVDRLQVEGQGKGYPFRLLRMGRSWPKGPLIENSGVDRLRVEGHVGP